MSGTLPSIPRPLEDFAQKSEELELLKQHPAYTAFLEALDELRALNYLDILNSGSELAILTAVGEGRALAKVARMVDERAREGRSLVERFDGAAEAYRLRKEAEQRAYAPHHPQGPRRNFEAG